MYIYLQDVFVFTAFCAPYKFQRSLWRTWMRILTRVPNSVLWLLDYIGDASKTMRLEVRVFFPLPRILFSFMIIFFVCVYLRFSVFGEKRKKK